MTLLNRKTINKIAFTRLKEIADTFYCCHKCTVRKILSEVSH